MATIYVYTRVSTPDQADAIAMQNRVAEAKRKAVIDRDTAYNNGVPHEWATPAPMSEKVSAFKRRFQDRPVGALICQMLKPGDHIVFARFDRYVRLTKDHVLQTEEFTKLGVTLHFADLDVTIGTAAGDLMATFFSAIAQYYSQSLSERIKAAWQERHVYGTKFPPRNKVLVKKVTRPGLPTLTVVNKDAIVYLRYVVHLRRVSYLRDGVPLSWRDCEDRLEAARVQRGDIPAYRARFNRKAWGRVGIQTHLRRLMSSEIPALNSPKLVTYFRNGLNPFDLGQKKNGPAKGSQRMPTNLRATLFDHLRQTGQTRPVKKAKRWAQQHDGCRECESTTFKHVAQGLCSQCYEQHHKAG